MKKRTRIIVVISCVCVLCSVLLVNCFAISGGSQFAGEGGYCVGISAELATEWIDRYELYGIVFPFVNIPVNQSYAEEQLEFDDQYTQLRLNYSYSGAGDFVYDLFTFTDETRVFSSYEIAQIDSPVGENNITDGARVFDTIRFNYAGVPLNFSGLGFGNEFVTIEGPTDVPPEFGLRFTISVPVTIIVDRGGSAGPAALTNDFVITGAAVIPNPDSNSGINVFDAESYDFLYMRCEWNGNIHSLGSGSASLSKLGDLVSPQWLESIASDGVFDDDVYTFIEFAGVCRPNARIDGELMVAGGDGVLPTDFMVISDEFAPYGGGGFGFPIEITEEIVVEEVHYDKVEPLEWLFQAGQGVLDMELFGSLTIGHLLLVAIAVPALLAILRAIAGG